jgi:IS4 transposase
MILPAILDPFARGAAATVMVRMALEWLIDEATLNRLFDRTAESQYTRELTPRAAFAARHEDVKVSAAAFYGKLNRMELGITAAVVGHTAALARSVIEASGGRRDEPIPGYAARVLDGNVLSGTEHRIAPLRRTRAAGLPGKALAVYEPATELVLQFVPCEDAYAQERSLLGGLTVEAGELWIADRNFCERKFLRSITERGAYFLVRRHKTTLPFRTLGDLRHVGRTETGEVFEHEIEVQEPDGAGVHVLRRIVLVLDRPTRDGDTEIELITSLPSSVSAMACCEAYRDRWQIEGHFQTLTELLHCEVPSLGQPRAALFAFGMSLVASHALAMLKASLRTAHGEGPAGEVSPYLLIDEVSHVYRGMMLAVPAPHWGFVRDTTAAELAATLSQVAGEVPVDRMRRSRRGPKKPRNTPKSRDRHLSTKRLLDGEQAKRAP